MFDNLKRQNESQIKSGPEIADEILTALDNLKMSYPDYFESMFAQRLVDGFGSRYDITDPNVLKDAIFNSETLSNAEEFTPAVGAYPNCKYYHVPHPDLIAKLGVVALKALDENIEIRWADPKNLKEFAATYLVRNFSELMDVRYTTIVIDTYENIVTTFFPGDTFDMSKMMVKGSKPKNTTAKGAIENGIFYAKTCDEQEWEKIK